MPSAITRKIKVTVSAQYSAARSDPPHFVYVFEYTICIENGSAQTVQLIKRHWKLFDSIGEFREVEGLGVQGEQPVLKPGETYEYSSSAEFKTEIATMHGTYLMQQQGTTNRFEVVIPHFYLEAPLKGN